MAEGNELAFMIGGLFLSLSAFSLLLGDNYLFRLGASILSGAVSAYICVLIAENYFYPLILEIVDGYSSLTTLQIIRSVLTLAGIVLIFCKTYTRSKIGGKVVMAVLMAVCAAVLVLGSAGGTIPAFIRTLADRFRISSLNAADKGNAWYWVKAGATLLSAIIALLYTRHFSFSGKKVKNTDKSPNSLLGDIVIGFTFGAIAAAVFLTAANILVNHVSGLIGTFQTLAK